MITIGSCHNDQEDFIKQDTIIDISHTLSLKKNENSLETKEEIQA